MQRILASVFALALTASLHAQPAAAPAPATQAAPKQEPDVAAIKYDSKTGQKNEKFLKLHEEYVDRAKKGNVDVLFLGDSITNGWRSQKDIWEKHFGRYNPANFGIGGDRTQHVLWRIENGELEGIKPKVAVLMIGTNNVAHDKPDRIAAGVTKIVETIKSKLPSTKVLLLAVFPRGQETAHEARAKIKQINEAIARLDDGGKTVRYLDIGDKFLQPDGTISKDIMPDYLHLSKQGYEIWANALDAPLAEMTK
jgi:lysophospholipase L1-like esterase